MNTFNINDLIQKGTDAVREFKLEAGTVYVRPLTDLEMQEASCKMFESFSEEELKEYMKPGSDVSLNDANVIDVMRANIEVDLFVAYTAMKDFAEDPENFSADALKKLNGIGKLSEFVREISGYGEDAPAEVKTFRKKSTGAKAKLSVEK